MNSIQIHVEPERYIEGSLWSMSSGYDTIVEKMTQLSFDARVFQHQTFLALQRFFLLKAEEIKMVAFTVSQYLRLHIILSQRHSIGARFLW